MSKQVWISDSAYAYLMQIQTDIYKEQGVKHTINDLVSKAILNNIEGE